MRQKLLVRFAVIALGLFGLVDLHAEGDPLSTDGNPKSEGPQYRMNGTGPVAPATPPQALATIYYTSTWQRLSTPAATVRACVLPEVRTGGAKGSGPSPKFDLSLLSSPANPALVFNPVTVPSLPPRTKQKLEPRPVWCATVPGGLPPSLVLQIAGVPPVPVKFARP